MLKILKNSPHSCQEVKINVTKHAPNIQKGKCQSIAKMGSKAHLERPFLAQILTNWENLISKKKILLLM